MLGREDLDEARGEVVELVARIDVPVQRRAVELGENVDPAESGIETVADREIDQPVFAAQRDRGFGSLFRQRKKACSRAPAHDDGESF